MTERIDRILQNQLFRTTLEQIVLQEQGRIFCGHGAEHLLAAARTAALIAADEGLNVDRELLYAAALLHDLGRAAGAAEQHEARSACLAETILTDCGYSEIERAAVLNAIIEHRSGWTGERSIYGDLLYRADKESRPCFACPSSQLCNWPESKKNLHISY